MLLGELTDRIITADPIFRVTARNVMLESKGIDSGMRVKLYISHPVIMYYFIRYCDVSTRHHFTGSLNVSAYTFDDSTRAFTSIRLSVDAARPLPNLDDDGQVIGTTARRVRVRDYDRNHRFLKLKFIIYKYVWENINDEDMVMRRGLNIDTFALQLSDMYEDLVSSMIVVSNFNPVSMEETVTRPATVPGSNRPVPRVTKIVYSYNDNVRRTEDWTNNTLSLELLTDDRHQFAVSIFVSREAPTRRNSESNNNQMETS